jgi:hypothetical protein
MPSSLFPSGIELTGFPPESAIAILQIFNFVVIISDPYLFPVMAPTTFPIVPARLPRFSALRPMIHVEQRPVHDHQNSSGSCRAGGLIGFPETAR